MAKQQEQGRFARGQGALCLSKTAILIFDQDNSHLTTRWPPISWHITCCR